MKLAFLKGILGNPLVFWGAAGVGAIASLALTVAVAYQWGGRLAAEHRADKVQSELTQCQRNTDILKSSVSTLTDAVNDQSTKIDELKLKADEAVARAQIAVNEKRAASASAQRQINEILHRKASGDLCSAAFDLMRKGQ